MAKVGRPERNEKVRKTTAVFTEEQEEASDEIRFLLPKTRGIRASANSDILGFSLIDTRNRLRDEWRVKSAATKPRM